MTLSEADHSLNSRNFIYACEYGLEVTVREYLSSGIDVNVKDRFDSTALIKASTNGCIAIVDMLLQAGADVHAYDTERATALKRASDNDFCEIVTLLLEAKSDINCKDIDGDTPLIGAVICGNDRTVKILLKYGADPSIKNFEGKNAFMYACEHVDLELIRIFIRENVDINDIFLIEEYFLKKILLHHEINRVIQNRLHEISPENMIMWKKFRLRKLFS